MKRIRTASTGLTLIACLGMLFPTAAFGATPAVQQGKPTLDVSLHAGGLLVGQVVNPQGTAKDSVEIAILHNGRELARTKTDKLGRFAIKGLTNGAYQLATAESQLPVRAWSKETAPPKIAVGAMLVEGTTVRGQCNSCNSGSYGHAGHSGQVSGGYTEGYSGGYGNVHGAARFNQGGYGGVQNGAYDSGTVYSGDSGVVSSGDAGVATSGDNGVVTSGDAGATYVDGSSGYYDGSSVSGGAQSYANGGTYTGGAQGYVDGGTYGGSYASGAASYGGGYAPAAGGFGGGAAASTGGGLLGGGGIFGGAGLLSSPWIIGAGVAAAVAIPVALDDDDAS